MIEYFDNILAKLEAMTDTEFNQLMIDSGIEKCELEGAEV